MLSIINITFRAVFQRVVGGGGMDRQRFGPVLPVNTAHVCRLAFLQHTSTFTIMFQPQNSERHTLEPAFCRKGSQVRKLK